jgi:hypothetical protein
MLAVSRPLPDVTGAVCEALLAQTHYYRGARVPDARVLFLRLRDRGWLRIFIDADVVFWQDVDGPDTPGQHDRHHTAMVDVAAAHGHAGKRLLGISVRDLPAGGEIHLSFADAPAVVLRKTPDESALVVQDPPASH